MITSIDQETLEKYLPFTKDVKGSKIFASYTQPLEDADLILKRSLLGVGLYDLIKKAFAGRVESTPLGDNDYQIGCTIDELKDAVMRAICNRAAYMNAGKNDLVQTSFGFGTVSGNQEAIASSTRVEAMKADCKRAYEDAEDSIIKMLIGNSYTKDAALSSWAWLKRTKFLVWTKEEMREIFPVINGEDSVAMHENELPELHDSVGQVVSRALLDSLISSMRNGSVSDSQQRLIDQCKTYISAIVRKDVSAQQNIKQDIYSTLDKYSFPEWEASEECAARKISPLENKKNSGAFFMI